MLDEQVQDPNLAAAQAFLDAALDFLGDEVAALGPRWKGAREGGERKACRLGQDLQSLLPGHDGDVIGKGRDWVDAGGEERLADEPLRVF